MARSLLSRYKGWAGGVYLLDDPAPDQAINILNMILEANGKAYKRPGSTDIGSIGFGSDRILSTYLFNRGPSVAAQLMAHVTDGEVYYSTDGGQTWATTSPVTSPFSTTNPVSFETFNGILYMADGENDMQKWDGSTLSAVGGGAPKARFLRLWKDTMWALRTTANVDRLYSSAPADANTWPGSNFVDITKGDGFAGTGLYIDNQFLIVGKQNKTHVVVNPATFENRPLDYDKGLESHFSVVQYEGEVYYITRFGVARHISSGPAEIVSNNIRPLFSPGGLALNSLHLAYGYVFGTRCGWTVVRAGQSTPDFQIEYSPQLPRKPWTFHQLPARCFVTLRDAGERLFYGRTTSNDFTEAFSGATDSDTVFKGRIEARWDDFGAPNIRKYLRRVRVLGEGRVNVAFRNDHREAAGKMFVVDLVPGGDPKWNEVDDKWGGGDKWGTFGTVTDKFVSPDLYARYFSVVVSDADDESILTRDYIGDERIPTNRGWSIMGLVLDAVAMGELP